MLTGLQCPGCGSQRAIHALLTGELGQAWHFNALMVASLPFLLLLAVADIMRQRLPSFYARLNSVAVIYTVAVVIVVWWIGRNLL